MKILLFVAVLLLVQQFTEADEPFCKNIAIDDAMRYKGVLTIFQKDQFWEIRERKVPFTTPKAADAKKIKDHFPGITDGSIDAIAEVGDEKTDEFVWIKNRKIHFMKDRKTEEKVMNLKDLLGGPVEDGHITLWFNKKSGHLFLFTGHRYNEFEKMSGSWKQVDPKNRNVVRDFKINVHIESAFSVGDFGYLLSGNWFFKVPLIDFMWPGTAYGGQLSLGWRRENEPLGLFNTKEDCGMEEKAFFDMAYSQDLNNGLKDPKEVGVDATYEAVPGNQPSNPVEAQEEEPELPAAPGTAQKTPGTGSKDDGKGAGKGKGVPSGADPNTGLSGPGGKGTTVKSDESKSGGIPNYVWYIVAGVGILIAIVIIAGVFFFLKSRRSSSRPGRSPSRG